MALDYAMFEIDDLLRERTALDQEIKARADQELAAIEARKAQLLEITGQAKAKVKAVIVAAVKPRDAGKAKYRHWADPTETWTGRGPKPLWMKAWLSQGKDPNELLIPA